MSKENQQQKHSNQDQEDNSNIEKMVKKFDEVIKQVDQAKLVFHDFKNMSGELGMKLQDFDWFATKFLPMVAKVESAILDVKDVEAKMQFITKQFPTIWESFNTKVAELDKIDSDKWLAQVDKWKKEMDKDNG